MLRKFLSLREIAKSLLALVLVALCLIAGNWQWNKGQALSTANGIIKSNLAKPELTESDLLGINPISAQWRTVVLHGRFDSHHQLLIRDRYNNGVFGFEVLQLFSSETNNYWIDRGWVKAGATAKTPPTIPPLSQQAQWIRARIRSEDVSRQLHGSFFAIPTSVKQVPKLHKIQGVTAAPYYLDELNSNEAKINPPLTVIALPDLSNGPHYAYAIQWFAFALLILIARGMLFRETHRLSLEEIEVQPTQSN